MITILDVMTDPELFGEQFGGESFKPWRALMCAFYGVPFEDDEAQRIFEEITGRSDAPTTPSSELWLVVGRRGGKSQTAALIAVYESCFRDYADMLSPGEMATVAVLAADKKQARTVFRYIQGLIHSNPMLSRLVQRADKESIELGRTIIEVTTASHRSTRGYSFACVIADEIAFWRSEDSANPDHEIIAAIRPGMASLDGRLIAMSSPYSRRGELWNHYKRYFGQQDPNIMVAQAPTWTMNQTLPQRIYDEAYQRDPSSAAAEYGAQFRSDIEAVLTIEAVENVEVPGRYELPHITGNRYTAFVDPAGGSGADAFTLCIAHREGRRKVVVDAMRSIKPPFSPEQVVSDFAVLLHQYRIKSVIGDRYGGEFPRELFRKQGITYELAEKSRSDYYRDFLPMVNSEQVELLDHAETKNQLVNLERRQARSGKVTIDHPPNGHDDMANSVAGVAVAIGARKQVRPLKDWL